MSKSRDKVNAVMAGIVETVIDAMKAGTAPWQRPWHQRGGFPTNVSTGNPYNGGNAMYLALLGSLKFQGANLWVGFGQCKKMGGSVLKGEKGTAILRPLIVPKDKADPEAGTKMVGFKVEYVWHISQTTLEQPEVESNERMLDATKLDEFVANTGAKVEYGYDRACFIPSQDVVHMPKRTAFKSEGGYYGTLLHELTHWTGHKSRLNRLSDKSREGYAFEDLVAELGAFYASEMLD